MDQQQKKTSARPGRKGRWSIVDSVIALLILLAIGGVIYRVVMSARRDQEAAAHQIYEVYVEVEETSPEVLAEVQGFDAVYLCENDARLGHVGVYKDGETGEYQAALTTTATESGRVKATGCLIVSGLQTKEGSLLVEGSGRYLTPGSELEIRTDRARLTVRVTEIRAHD